MPHFNELPHVTNAAGFKYPAMYARLKAAENLQGHRVFTPICVKQGLYLRFRRIFSINGDARGVIPLTCRSGRDFSPRHGVPDPLRLRPVLIHRLHDGGLLRRRLAHTSGRSGPGQHHFGIRSNSVAHCDVSGFPT